MLQRSSRCQAEKGGHPNRHSPPTATQSTLPAIQPFLSLLLTLLLHALLTTHGLTLKQKIHWSHLTLKKVPKTHS